MCCIHINIVNDIIFKNHTVCFAKPKLIKYTPRTHTYRNTQTFMQQSDYLAHWNIFMQVKRTATHILYGDIVVAPLPLICGNSWYVFLFSVLVLLIANCALFYGSGKSRFGLYAFATLYVFEKNGQVSVKKMFVPAFFALNL